MMYRTHLAFAFLVSLFTIKLFPNSNIYLFTSLTLLGSLLPDLDHPRSKLGKKIPFFSKTVSVAFGHRGIFHSLFFTVLVAYLASLFLPQYLVGAIFFGYLSHLVADSFTKMGVNYLHPFATLHIRGFIETGKTGELILFAILVTSSILKLLH